MAISAIIDRVIVNNNNIILDLMPKDVVGLAGQRHLTILNPTHIPEPGQEIWSTGDICLIEPERGSSDSRRYRRKNYTELIEDFDK